MTLSDQDLRLLVRDAVRRHLGAPGPLEPAPFDRTHPSHARLPLTRGGDEDGQCLIEPTVVCTHCGFCQSFGH